MVRQAVKVAIQGALFLQLLHGSSMLLNGLSFETTDDNQQATVTAANTEERGLFGFGTPAGDNFPTGAPVSGFTRPTTSSFLSRFGSFVDDFVDLDEFNLDGDASGDDDKTKEPATEAPSDSADGDKRLEDHLLDMLGGDDAGGAGDDDESAAPSGSGSDDGLLGDDLSGLLGGGSGSDDDLMGLLGGGSGTDDDLMGLLGGSMGGFGGSGSAMPSFDDFMKKYGGMFEGGGSGFSLFADPSVPQNKTIDDEDLLIGTLYGSKEHGSAFSDINNVRFGQMILNITLQGGERVDKISFVVMTQNEVGKFVHGGDGGGMAYLEPTIGDTIDSVEVHWGKHKGKTRIFYIQMITSGGKTISAGKKTPNSAIIKPPKGYQFAGFHGRASSSGIFGLGAIFTRTGVSDLEVTDVMAITGKGSPDIYNYKTTIRNWVGALEVARDNACYQRRVDVNSKNVCPSGYRQADDTCIAQCPLNYPVECFRECIPQNSDCAQAVIAKVASVASVVLNAATMGLFGALVSFSKTVQFALLCAVSVTNAVKNLLYYLRYTQVTIPRTDIEKLMDRAFQLQIATLDLPLAVSACLGIKIPPKLFFSLTIMTVVAAVVMMAVMIGEALFASKTNVMTMLRESGAMNTTALKSGVVELDTFLHSKNGTCGSEMKTLTNRVIGKVQEIRSKTPGANEDDVRVEVSKSVIITEDIPIITNHCMGEIWLNHTAVASYKTRLLLRKTLNVIIDQLIKDGTTDMGKDVSKDEKVIEYANIGLFILSIFDPTGIAWMASEFIQPICGPSEYIGEIDDGTLRQALGLTAVDQAFEGSYGVWKKEGDGTVTVHFESVDKYDVEVIIYSGGEKINSVKVPANGKMTWTATVKELEDKTFYMDRWRPGLFGLQGSGGGSLLMWIPRSSLGGQLVMHARLNVS